MDEVLTLIENKEVKYLCVSNQGHAYLQNAKACLSDDPSTYRFFKITGIKEVDISILVKEK
jgi:hypothetical protein